MTTHFVIVNNGLFTILVLLKFCHWFILIMSNLVMVFKLLFFPFWPFFFKQTNIQNCTNDKNSYWFVFVLVKKQLQRMNLIS